MVNDWWLMAFEICSILLHILVLTHTHIPITHTLTQCRQDIIDESICQQEVHITIQGYHRCRLSN